MISFSGITITKVSEDASKNSALFEIGPLPKGYGHTLANSLRRILLSSLEGAAITSVRINNLDHEFTTIPGVKQNLLDVVLRLKNLKISLNGDESAIMTLSKKGVGPITGADFTLGAGVMIMNKEYHIADLTDASSQLVIEAVVEKGTGYRRADESLRDEIGRIPVDSIFSPVRLVDAKVMPSRKGAKTDLDKVIINITTDGTVTPQESIKQAVSILVEFFQELVVVTGAQALTSSVMKEAVVANKLEGISEEVVAVLKEAGIDSVEAVSEKPKTYFSKELGLKLKQVKELIALLERNNLDFMKDEKKSKKTKS